MTAHASLSSSGGMLGKLGSGAVTASAALTGTGTVEVPGISLFYPSTSGPSSGISYASEFLAGIQFYVNASGHECTGFYIWVQLGTNPNPTIAQKCALWEFNGAGAGQQTFLAGATSGTLVAGWNLVNLSSPVSLTANQVYMAATGVNGNFNDTNSYFGTGDPGNGLHNGYLYAVTAANPQSGVQSGNFDNDNSDPTTFCPVKVDTGGNGWSNFWLDVVVQ